MERGSFLRALRWLTRVDAWPSVPPATQNAIVFLGNCCFHLPPLYRGGTEAICPSSAAASPNTSKQNSPLSNSRVSGHRYIFFAANSEEDTSELVLIIFTLLYSYSNILIVNGRN